MQKVKKGQKQTPTPIQVWTQKMDACLEQIQEIMEDKKPIPKDVEALLRVLNSWVKDLFLHPTSGRWDQMMSLKEHQMDYPDNQSQVMTDTQYRSILQWGVSLDAVSVEHASEQVKTVKQVIGTEEWQQLVQWLQGVSVEKKALLMMMCACSPNLLGGSAQRSLSMGQCVLWSLLVEQQLGVGVSASVSTNGNGTSNATEDISAIEKQGDQWHSWVQTSARKWTSVVNKIDSDAAVKQEKKSKGSKDANNSVDLLVGDWLYKMRTGDVPSMHWDEEANRSALLRAAQTILYEQQADVANQKSAKSQKEYVGLEHTNTKVHGIYFKSNNAKVLLSLMLERKNKVNSYLNSDVNKLESALRRQYWQSALNMDDRRLQAERVQVWANYIDAIPVEQWKILKEQILEQRAMAADGKQKKATVSPSVTSSEGAGDLKQNAMASPANQRVWDVLENGVMGLKMLKALGYGFDIDQVASMILEVSKKPQQGDALMNFNVMDRSLWLCAAMNVPQEKVSRRYHPIRLLLHKEMRGYHYDGMDLLEQLKIQQDCGWLSNYSGRSLLHLFSEAEYDWNDPVKTVSWLIDHGFVTKDKDGRIETKQKSTSSSKDIQTNDPATSEEDDGKEQQSKGNTKPLLHSWFGRCNWYSSRELPERLKEIDQVVHLLMEYDPKSLWEVSAAGATTLRALNSAAQEAASNGIGKEEQPLLSWIEKWFDYCLRAGMHPSDVLLKKEWEQTVATPGLRQVLTSYQEHREITQQLQLQKASEDEKVVSAVRALSEHLEQQMQNGTTSGSEQGSLTNMKHLSELLKKALAGNMGTPEDVTSTGVTAAQRQAPSSHERSGAPLQRPGTVGKSKPKAL